MSGFYASNTTPRVGPFALVESPCFQGYRIYVVKSLCVSFWLVKSPYGGEIQAVSTCPTFPNDRSNLFQHRKTLRRNPNENAARVPGSTLDSSTSGSLGASVPMGWISPDGNSYINDVDEYGIKMYKVSMGYIYI